MDVYTARGDKRGKDTDIRRQVGFSSYQPKKEYAERLPEEEPKHKKKRKLSWKKRFLLFFIFLFLITAGPLAYVGFWNLRNFSSASEKLFGSSNAFSLVSSRPLASSRGRVNILLAGYSVDDPGHGGAELTDSILVMSLDQEEKTGYMLSVPRDLYVDIPEYGSAKINEAYQAGERRNYQKTGYPDGGMGLLEEVIEENFGLQIHYYTLVDYTAVREIVDALGGITVDIESDDPRGLYDPSLDLDTGKALVNLKNGKNNLNGQQALGLTRARGAVYGSYGYALSDFTRTQNQQKVFQAIQNELTWRLVLDPRTNKEIFDAAADNLVTDVELSEVLSIYRLFTDVPNNKIKTYTLRDINDENLLTGYTTPFGQSALIPAAGLGDFSEIQEAVSRLD